ncbi:MAG: hypothetical protein AAF902_04915 [Chloroflexota bacterium]
MFRRRQEEWHKPIWPEVEKYLWWALFVGVLVWAFIQLYSLMLYVNLVWVNNETWRLPGWTSFTIHALTRITGFTLGTIWLGLMVWSEQFLDKALRQEKLRPRAYKMLGYALGLGIVSIGLLTLLPWLWGVPN